MDGKGHGVGNGMVHMDELHGEAARLYDVAGVMGHELRLAHKVVLLKLELDEPSVSGVACTGALTACSTYGSAPMWSSWPWVMKKPRSFFWFSQDR